MTAFDKCNADPMLLVKLHEVIDFMVSKLCKTDMYTMLLLPTLSWMLQNDILRSIM